MTSRRLLGAPTDPESGGALVLAIVVIAMATVFTSGILQLTSAVSNRQTLSVDNQRAFYLAEAGLSEGFEALRVGKRGQIGSIEAPAKYGNGLVWVDATPTPDNQMRLEATAVCGSGRSTLALVVERVEVPIGIFSDEDLVLDTVLLVDGFDSSNPPVEQFEEIYVDPTKYKHVDEERSLLFYEGAFYRFTGIQGDTFQFSHSTTVQFLSEHPDYGNGTQYDIDADDFVDDPLHLDFLDVEYLGVIAYFEHIAGPATPTATTGESSEASPDVFDLASDWLSGWGSGDSTNDADAGSIDSSYPLLSPTELDAVDALVGSNGDITVGGAGEAVQIHGDVLPGAENQVVLGSGGFVSGDTDPRAFAVELPEVEVPTVSLQSPITHDSLVPLIVSPGTLGFQALHIASDAELVIRGPATIVVGQLTLAAGAFLTLDTTDGPVELFVTDEMHLEQDSTVLTPNSMPADVSVQVSADDSGSLGAEAVRLRSRSQFYGTIYAPEAEVVVGGEFEFFGSIAARVLDLEPGAKLHYDASGGDAIPQIVSWKIVEVPAKARATLGSLTYAANLNLDQLLPLSEAHDLGGILIDVDYIDLNGAAQTYLGAEADFDWTQVDEVLSADRDGWDDWDSGWYNDWWNDWGESWWSQFAEGWSDSWGSNWGSWSDWGDG